MNLHAVAAGVIAAVNPSVPVTVYFSAGYATNSDGTQVPAYEPQVGLTAQIQSLTFRDLVQTASLNLQGTRRAIYFYGDVEGIVRLRMKGGDIVVFPDNSVWLVAITLETWPGWSKVAATLQTDLTVPLGPLPQPAAPTANPWPSV